MPTAVIPAPAGVIWRRGRHGRRPPSRRHDHRGGRARLLGHPPPRLRGDAHLLWELAARARDERAGILRGGGGGGGGGGGVGAEEALKEGGASLPPSPLPPAVRPRAEIAEAGDGGAPPLPASAAADAADGEEGEEDAAAATRRDARDAGRDLSEVIALGGAAGAPPAAGGLDGEVALDERLFVVVPAAGVGTGFAADDACALYDGPLRGPGGGGGADRFLYARGGGSAALGAGGADRGFAGVPGGGGGGGGSTTAAALRTKMVQFERDGAHPSRGGGHGGGGGGGGGQPRADAGE
ncbi:hypothetical protein BU14_0033s0041 [Porphyra umbilicalis]|uniref:Uncharacterized protein n=1 Tax=Porphyra umbilicalis TaxID=2786 RepID=A0A1X6PIN2_PORUM|nr:hypothetical protein BU14_0033s0041 [Porphyra umbilicalis]|eukprot:OSX80697.1 hypothetical protein BU14_0033s0041 [Porphyra umbilicalis]